MTFHVHIKSAEECGFVVSCPALPGCWSQGESVHDALANIQEAIGGWLAANDNIAPERPVRERNCIIRDGDK